MKLRGYAGCWRAWHEDAKPAGVVREGCAGYRDLTLEECRQLGQHLDPIPWQHAYTQTGRSCLPMLGHEHTGDTNRSSLCASRFP